MTNSMVSPRIHAGCIGTLARGPFEADLEDDDDGFDGWHICPYADIGALLILVALYPFYIMTLPVLVPLCVLGTFVHLYIWIFRMLYDLAKPLLHRMWIWIWMKIFLC